MLEMLLGVTCQTGEEGDMKKGDKNHRLAFVSFSVVVFYCLYLPECRVDATARGYSLVWRFCVWYVADCVRLPLQKA